VKLLSVVAELRTGKSDRRGKTTCCKKALNLSETRERGKKKHFALRPTEIMTRLKGALVPE
jgi:hypothetical protein